MTDMAGKTMASPQRADVAEARHQIFMVGFARINDAMEHLYFLEAICLIGSLLADRMESRVADHLEAFSGFMNLGPLLRVTCLVRNGFPAPPAESGAGPIRSLSS